MLVYWPVTRTSGDGSTSEQPRTRLVRIAPDGSRAFVPPFGELEPGSRDTRINVEDEILPLPDGSILFSQYNAIDRRRPNGSIARFAGTGRYSEHSSGDGGPATAADIGFAHGLSRFPDGSIVFGDGSRVRRVAPDGVFTTVAIATAYACSRARRCASGSWSPRWATAAGAARESTIGGSTAKPMTKRTRRAVGRA